MSTTAEQQQQQPSYGQTPVSPEGTATSNYHSALDTGVVDDDDLSQEPDPTEIKPWDEGGVSDCGYSVNVHETLMSVGQSVHNIVGPPSETVKSGMGSVGNWFQEASYAVRDIVRGENHKELQEDASQVFGNLIHGESGPKPTAAPPSTTA